VKFAQITKESTVIEALQACRDVWIEIARSENPWKKPEKALRVYTGGCPACEYFLNRQDDGRTHCPDVCVMKVAWPEGCCSKRPESPYAAWRVHRYRVVTLGRVYRNQRKIRTAAWRIAHAAQTEIGRKSHGS